MLLWVHRKAGVVPQKGEHLVILYERLLVPGHPCSSLVLPPPWELLVSVVLGHPWKWLPSLYHGHPWKWVQGILLEMDLATVRLVWVGLVMRWEGLLDMPQLFSSFQILHGKLQWPRVENHIGWRIHL